MVDYKVRFAQSEDVEEILPLWYEYSDELSRRDSRYQSKDDAGERWKDYFLDRMVDSSKAAVLVADAGDEHGLLGVIEVRVMGGHPIFQLGKHGVVFGHHVATEYQGMGIEADLLAAAEEWFGEKQNLQFFRVEVLHNNDYLKEIYEEYGLEVIEHTYEGDLA